MARSSDIMETSACGKSKKYYCTLNWKAAIFVKITDYSIYQNFAPYDTFKIYIHYINTIIMSSKNRHL